MSQVTLFSNISELVSMQGAEKGPPRSYSEEDLTVLKDAAFLTQRGQIIWAGKRRDLKASRLKQLTNGARIKEVDLQKRTVLPGFVECHTHLVFAGHRSHEFEMRVKGATYQEIAAAGGGIISTVKETRKASEKALLSLAQERVNRFVAQGVTQVEVKSGYGLDTKTESKMLKVARQLVGPEVITTFLGGHAVPPEARSVTQYFDKVLKEMLPAVIKKDLVDRVDIFVEEGFFSLDHLSQLSAAIKDRPIQLTVHGDQLTRTGACAQAAALGAISVDHAVKVSSADIKTLAKCKTVAVLLPGADFYIKVSYPPARELINAGVNVALATDFNPGSCPTQELSFIGLLARQEMKMTLPECLVAYTLGAARALGTDLTKGSISIGKSCDFAVLDGNWRDLFYQVGYHPIVETWRSGKKISKKLKK